MAKAKKAKKKKAKAARPAKASKPGKKAGKKAGKKIAKSAPKKKAKKASSRANKKKTRVAAKSSAKKVSSKRKVKSVGSKAAKATKRKTGTKKRTATPARTKSKASSPKARGPAKTQRAPKARTKSSKSSKASAGAELSSSLHTMPQVGDDAPDFTLPVIGSEDGAEVRLSSLLGHARVVLYFYPKDDTPGCTKQACAFQDDMFRFADHDVTVLGISPDSLQSHERFRTKYQLDFPLASDQDQEVAKKYGVWVEKNMYGRTYMGIQRATFLIDQDGRIAKVWAKVKVDGHSQDVLDAISQAGEDSAE